MKTFKREVECVIRGRVIEFQTATDIPKHTYNRVEPIPKTMKLVLRFNRYHRLTQCLKVEDEEA